MCSEDNDGQEAQHLSDGEDDEVESVVFLAFVEVRGKCELLVQQQEGDDRGDILNWLKGLADEDGVETLQHKLRNILSNSKSCLKSVPSADRDAHIELISQVVRVNVIDTKVSEDKELDSGPGYFSFFLRCSKGHIQQRNGWKEHRADHEAEHSRAIHRDSCNVIPVCD